MKKTKQHKYYIKLQNEIIQINPLFYLQNGIKLLDRMVFFNEGDYIIRMAITHVCHRKDKFNQDGSVKKNEIKNTDRHLRKLPAPPLGLMEVQYEFSEDKSPTKK